MSMVVAWVTSGQIGIRDGWIMPRICGIGNWLAAGYNQFALILSDMKFGHSQSRSKTSGVLETPEVWGTQNDEKETASSRKEQRDKLRTLAETYSVNEGVN
jgi:hypothetical protein